MTISNTVIALIAIAIIIGALILVIAILYGLYRWRKRILEQDAEIKNLDNSLTNIENSLTNLENSLIIVDKQGNKFERLNVQLDQLVELNKELKKIVPLQNEIESQIQSEESSPIDNGSKQCYEFDGPLANQSITETRVTPTKIEKSVCNNNNISNESLSPNTLNGSMKK